VRTLELAIGAGAYELRLDGELLARLEGGAATLLGGAPERLREAHVEAAIERAEDWLMPFSRPLQDLPLRVHDDMGRLRGFLGECPGWDAAQLEQAFDRAHEAVAHGRIIDPLAVAAIVLLRELAHHGRLAGIWLDA
jgi:hypothetical protein